MRADRLLAMLMTLQSRGKVTARELAGELEVSIRTVHRDVIALSTAGVPVYTERGPAGGIALVESYRTDLTGMTKDQVRALFMMSIPPALAELGFDQELQDAMRKLSAALPAALREQEEGVRQRIHLDPAPWDDRPRVEVASVLQILQKALWDSIELEIRHTTQMRPDLTPLQSILHPYGLVAKAGVWYLVGKRKDHLKVLRVDQIVEVHQTESRFERPENFSLAAFWQSYCQKERQHQPIYPVLVRARPDLLPYLPRYLGKDGQVRVREDIPPDPGGRLLLEFQFDFFEGALKELLALGCAVEVIEPIALRCSIKDYAEQILGIYTSQRDDMID